MSAYTALARKWRPHSFAEMTGQEHVLRALANALASGRVHHAFLFAGTRGVGKTTVARILAKCLNCERGVSATPCGECASCREIDAGRSVDLIEVDAASRTRVDDTRELLDNVQYAPTRSRYKIYLIDEVHMLSAHSFNALLKTLEEPPPHVKFLLATTDPQKLPVTVLSRCLQFNLKRLSVALISARLTHILQAEQHRVRAGSGAAAGAGRRRQSARRIVAAGSAARLRQWQGAGSRRARHARYGRARSRAARSPSCWRRAMPPRCSTTRARSTSARRTTRSCSISLRRCSSASRSSSWCRASRAMSCIRRSCCELARGHFAPRICSSIIRRRSSAGATWRWRPMPRTGFRMTLIRMLAFRPARAAVGAGACCRRRRHAGRAAPRAASPPMSAAAAASRSRQPSRRGAHGAVPPVADGCCSDWLRHGRRGAVRDAGARIGVERADWSAIVAALELQGLPRQLAANCALLGRDGATCAWRSIRAAPRCARARWRISWRRRCRAISAPRCACEIDAARERRTRRRRARPSAREAERRAQARIAFEADPIVESAQGALWRERAAEIGAAG